MEASGDVHVPGVTVRRLHEVPVEGRGVFHRLREGLGVASFGINVERWPPHCDLYPEHDETATGQEEVYTVLEGRAYLHVGGREIELAPGTFVRVDPSVRRKFVTRDDEVTLLCIGGVPGGVFTPGI